jgi:hypothetical protein
VGHHPVHVHQAQSNCSASSSAVRGAEQRGGSLVIVTVAGSPLELILHAFGRRSAADVQVDGSSDDVDSFSRLSFDAVNEGA